MLFHQIKNKKVYWKIHTAGLINQMMSVETGAGVAFMEKTPIYFYKTNIDKNRTIHPSGFVPQKRRKLYTGTGLPTVFDLISIPNDIKYSINEEHDLNQGIKKTCLELSDILGFYYKCDEGSNEKQFAEGRTPIPKEAYKSLHFTKYAFAFYSRFFFNRPQELDSFFSRLTFQKPYLDLAEKIAKSIGKFRGMHIRLTDHSNKYDASPENISSGQDYFINTDLPLIVSTDDKDKIITQTKIKCTFVDDIITENYAMEFMALPYHNEVVFGLISLLVMSYAEEFVGTPGSTFSSYIHRLRINRGLDDNLYYIKAGRSCDNYKQTGPFSWNGFQMHPNTKSWWQEWKECRLNLKNER